MAQPVRIILKRKAIPKPIAAVKAPKQSETARPIEQFLSDPANADLIKMTTSITEPLNPKFSVRNYVGGGFDRGTPQAISAHVQATLCNAVTFMASHCPIQMKNWPGTSILTVMPMAGVDLNAYYDRASLKFFYFNRKNTGTVYTAYSADIVTHELGHAILDILRPDLWGAALLEVWSYHEAFADFVALMCAFSYEEVLVHVLNQTGGDLRKPNVVTNIAEQVGSIIALLDPNSNRSNSYLRTALNNFLYVDPSTLPKNTTDTALAAEPHSFGRVFLGALYDCFVAIYDEAKTTNTPIEAMRIARDQITQYVLRASLNAPINAKFFESIAKTILWADATTNNKKYYQKLNNVFVNRNILSGIKMLSAAPECPAGGNLIKSESKLKCTLSQHFLSIQSNNELYNVEIEVPNEFAYFYDNDGNPLESIVYSNDDSVKGGADFVDYLNETKSYGDATMPFEVKKGKLVRNYIN